jgi:hypothetical protein
MKDEKKYFSIRDTVLLHCDADANKILQILFKFLKEYTSCSENYFKETC